MRTVTFNTKVRDGQIKIPDRYKNLETQNIEVILVLKDTPAENTERDFVTGNKARGILRDYRNPMLIKNEKAAWELAVKEKYACR